ncbi:type II secretion system F family protein [Vibrio aquimaris]|uniref:Type II secretion system protein F n=1 Tax=Vibrio aquimaris TaxID=2587862 RepID=A0A5P9CNB9_9VIBR|nr:type II secretion system F family protein [Vibrio aquimaris]QFT27227.1 Type II secretion system protein F [Vibrio aquimaris]
MSAPKLSRYYWCGFGSNAQKQQGTMLAISRSQVLAYLDDKSIDVSFILKRRLPAYRRMRERVNAKEITLLTRQWASMIDAGLPITTSLKLIANNLTKAGVSSVIWLIRQKLESGLSVTQTLKESSTHFDSLYLAIIHAGESSGQLAGSLRRIATHREKIEYIRSKAVGASIYPCLIFGTAWLVTLLMLTQVIPELERMFESYNAPLPWFTQQVINLSQTTINYGLHTTLGFILLIVSIRLGYRYSISWKKKLDRMKLLVPVFGKLYRLACLSQFIRTLATCFDSGLPITPSLHAAAQTFDNTFYQTAMYTVTQEVDSGVPIHQAMRSSGAFDEFIMQMVMLGEESGRLAEMLNRVADDYENEIEKIIDYLSRAIEPIVIVVLGTIVASLVTAMYLPIFNLVNVMS